jgi:hypothetical protein
MNAVYDAADNEMIVFGGGLGLNRYNDTTTLSNANGLGGTSVWTVLSPTGLLPPARNEHSVAYDVVNDVLITYGGFSGNGDGQPLLNDVWALSNASGAHGSNPAWTQLLPTGGATDPKSRLLSRLRRRIEPDDHIWWMHRFQQLRLQHGSERYFGPH